MYNCIRETAAISGGGWHACGRWTGVRGDLDNEDGADAARAGGGLDLAEHEARGRLAARARHRPRHAQARQRDRRAQGVLGARHRDRFTNLSRCFHCCD